MFISVNRAWAVRDGDGEAGWVSFGHAWPTLRALRGSPPKKKPQQPLPKLHPLHPQRVRLPGISWQVFSLPPAQQTGGERLWRLQHPFPSVPCPGRGVPGAAGEKFRGRRASDKSPQGTGDSTRGSAIKAGETALGCEK